MNTMMATESPRERELRGHGTRRYQLPMHPKITGEGPNPSGLCMCGCGAETGIAQWSRSSRGWVKGQPKRFILGHGRSLGPMPAANPDGMCGCGCGKPAPLARKTNTKLGHLKGRPVRFIAGHQGRVYRHTLEARARMSEQRKGTRTGPDNPMWNGGRTRERSRAGIRVGRDHPMADGNGLVLEHRLVMSNVLGRYLRPDELVHHINEDPFDNRPANLVVVSRAQHHAIHALRRCGFGQVESTRIVIQGTQE